MKRKCNHKKQDVCLISSKNNFGLSMIYYFSAIEKQCFIKVDVDIKK